VLAVDLNKDGIPDLVAVNQGGQSLNKGTVTVSLGKGKGEFAPARNYTLGNVGPYDVVAADFNGDNLPDLAAVLFGTSDPTVVGNEVDVLLNNGKGEFLPFTAYTIGTKPRSVGVADLNKDGKLDLIVANSTANNVGVLLGRGDGTFAPQVTYPSGHNPHGIAIADFDHDGNVDVALANNGPEGQITVLLGKGDGTLGDAIGYPAGAGTFGLAAGDLNGDGFPDIVTAGQRAQSVSVLLNTGKGTFTRGTDITLPGKSGGPVAVALADMNHDGKLDILAPYPDIKDPENGGNTYLLLGKGDGAFQPPIALATGNGSYGSVTGHFFKKNEMDFAEARTTGSVIIMKGNCAAHHR